MADTCRGGATAPLLAASSRKSLHIFV
jgi:hypothetical protein